MTNLERAERKRELVYLQTEQELAVHTAMQRLGKAMAETPDADHSSLEAEIAAAQVLGRHDIARLERLLAPPAEVNASLPPTLIQPIASPPPISPSTGAPSWLFSAILFGGAVVMAWSGRTFLSSLETLQWTPTPGTVTVSEMVITRAGTRTVAAAEFEYAYTIDGTSHSSRQVSASGTRTSGPSRWDVGDDVTVYVNPEVPGNAVLLTGPDVWTGVQVFTGLLLMAFGGIGARRRRQQPAE